MKIYIKKSYTGNWMDLVNDAGEDVGSYCTVGSTLYMNNKNIDYLPYLSEYVYNKLKSNQFYIYIVKEWTILR